MKSSTPNCNSNDQLLQLVSIQLLQKAYFRQFMFEGSYYFTVFLPYAGDFPSSQVTTTAGAGCGSVLVRQFPHLAAKLADREAPTQGSSSWNSATNARSYLSQYTTDLQLPVRCRPTAAEYWQQKLVANHQCATVPLMAQDVISAPASQAGKTFLSLWSAD